MIMQAVAVWFSQYWIYAVVFVAVCIVTGFICSKAGKAYRKRKGEYNAQEAEIKRLVAMKEKYYPLSQAAIESADEGELLEGAALSYQIELEKSGDMMGTFNAYSEEKKRIYTLDVFVSDKTLKTFFSQNGSELKNLIIPALEMIGFKAQADMIKEVYLMYDEKDETTSLSYEKIEEIQKVIDGDEFLTKIKHGAAKYMKDNPSLFVM